MATLLIDNYDSFTWNVYQHLSELGANVIVRRNDQITLGEMIAMNPRNIVISPGQSTILFFYLKDLVSLVMLGYQTTL